MARPAARPAEDEGEAAQGRRYTQIVMLWKHRVILKEGMVKIGCWS